MSTVTPLASFVVPCYNLAHLLPECLNSILGQTFEHFEIVIMDDGSSDHTPLVARTFHDHRIRYVRNEKNLGHLRNFDKGIALARGEYVWILSADDRLRQPYVLARFVEALRRYPSAGYVFCPNVRFQGSQDVDVVQAHGKDERLFRRPELLRALLRGNGVGFSAALARKRLYEQIGGFPLDLPFAGDWYVWARFALEADVVYLPEPMVDYRLHETNMTKDFMKSRAEAAVKDELEVRWRIKRDALLRGDTVVAKWALEGIADGYSAKVACHIGKTSPFEITLDAFEKDLSERHATVAESRLIRSTVYAAAGDCYWDERQQEVARQCYRKALTAAPSLRATMKYLLAGRGESGSHARDAITRLREFLRRFKRSATEPNHA